MPQYLIVFNDEWVPDLTMDDVRERGTAGRAVIEEMKTAGVFVFSDGGLDGCIASRVGRSLRPTGCPSARPEGMIQARWTVDTATGTRIAVDPARPIDSAVEYAARATRPVDREYAEFPPPRVATRTRGEVGYPSSTAPVRSPGALG